MMQRRKRSASKKKILNDHVGKGQGYKFNFDNEGDIFLYCTEDKKINKKENKIKKNKNKKQTV